MTLIFYTLMKNSTLDWPQKMAWRESLRAHHYSFSNLQGSNPEVIGKFFKLMTAHAIFLFGTVLLVTLLFVASELTIPEMSAISAPIVDNGRDLIIENTSIRYYKFVKFLYITNYTFILLFSIIYLFYISNYIFIIRRKRYDSKNDIIIFIFVVFFIYFVFLNYWWPGGVTESGFTSGPLYRGEYLGGIIIRFFVTPIALGSIFILTIFQFLILTKRPKSCNRSP